MRSVAYYEHECGLIRVQAVTQGEEMLDRAECALGVASRHLERVRTGVLEMVPMVAEEIEESIALARDLLGIGPAARSRPMYECPRCGRISYNPQDLANRYCGACHQFESPETP